jgi:hypothetical protein
VIVYLLWMRTAIEKIIKNFVLKDVSGADYSVEVNQGDDNLELYEIYIYLPHKTDREEVLIIKERLERALSHLGLRGIFGGLYDYKNQNKFVINVRGRYRP